MNQTNPQQLILLGVLVLAVVGVVIYQTGLLSGGGSTSSQTSTAAQSQVPETRFVDIELNVDELIARTQSINFDYAQERIDRDPMRPLVGQLAQATGSGVGDSPISLVTGPISVQRKSITGIVWDPYNPQAVVDNEVVQIGHRYPDGVRVYDIEEKRVTFQVGDTLIRVDMKEPGQ